MTVDTATQESAYWFIYANHQLLICQKQDQSTIPLLNTIEAQSLLTEPPQLIGHIDAIPCFAGLLKQEAPLPEHLTTSDLRPLFGKFDDRLFWMAGRAAHLLYWRNRTRFCGICGSPTYDKADECAKVCEKCGEIYYPRIAPAIIVAIIKDGQILLAKGNRFIAPFYSVIAGFVEPGETLEECVHREVMEEVGIQVKNIRYFTSQPWPFPDSLMVGFIADYADGEIVVDLNENSAAAWFAPDNLPPIPRPVSIARHLIDWFREEYGQNSEN